MRRPPVELMGTVPLIFTVGMTVIRPDDARAMAPLAIAAALMMMTYAEGLISGGHCSPAVTLGVLLRGKLSLAEAILTGSPSSRARWPPPS